MKHYRLFFNIKEMNKKVSELLNKGKELFNKNKKQSYVIIITIIIVFWVIILKSVFEWIENEKRKELMKSQNKDDQTKIEYIDKFKEQATSPKIKRLWWLSTYSMNDYYFHVDDVLTLKDYFNTVTKNRDWIEYGDFKETITRKWVCSWQEDIFKVKKTKLENWLPDTHIYVALCLEGKTNHIFDWNTDHWFLKKYYEFMIWDWTKEEILKESSIEDVDFESDEYQSILPWYTSWRDLTPEFRNKEKERFINNFNRWIYKENYTWHNKKWYHYHFFIDNEKDVKKYFYRYSGLSVDDEVFEDFINKKQGSSCTEWETIFRFKETSKKRSLFDMDWVKTFKHVYIWICLDNENGKKELWWSDSGFSDDYLEIKIWNWEKEEIFNK